MLVSNAQDWFSQMEELCSSSPEHAVDGLRAALVDMQEADQAKAHYLLAQCYRKLHQQQNEESALMACIGYFKELGQRELYYFCNIGLAKVNANFGRYEASMNYLKEAQELATEANNREWMIRVYDNLGLLHSRMSRNEESVAYYTEALKLLRNTPGGNQLQSMKTNIYLGNVYIKMKLYDRAYDHFTMALTESKPEFNSYDSQMPLRGLAYLFLDQKKPAAAKRFLDKAHQLLLQKSDIISEMRLFLLDAEYEKQLGNYSRAKEILEGGLRLFQQQEVAVLKIQYLRAMVELDKKIKEE